MKLFNRLTSFWRSLPRLVPWLFQALGISIFAFLVFIFTLGVFFFATPEITLDRNQVGTVAEILLPSAYQVEFSDAKMQLLRLPGREWILTKKIKLHVENFCLRYKKKGVVFCTPNGEWGVVYGWGPRQHVETTGQRTPAQHSGNSEAKPKPALVLPRLFSLSPFKVARGELQVDIGFLKSAQDSKEKPEKKRSGGLAFLEFIRLSMLPKWEIQGSQIEIDDLRVQTEKSLYLAKFDLETEDQGRAIKVTLRDLKTESRHNLPKASGARTIASARSVSPVVNGVLRLVRPVGQNPDSFWKASLETKLQLSQRQEIRVSGDAEVYAWEDIDFRLKSFWRGVATLREAHLRGRLIEERFDGVYSMKMGGASSYIRAVDFLDCQVFANLEQQIGELNCGPQSVQLVMRGSGIAGRLGPVTFSPTFHLLVDRMQFGQTKEAVLKLSLELRHKGLVELTSDFSGVIRKPDLADWEYAINGGTEARIPQFNRWVRILRGTPYAVPAPMNMMSGPLTLRLTTQMNQEGGQVLFENITRLNSKYQALHFTLRGQTDFDRKQGIRPRTDLDLQIERVRISAPRFDLRAPPQMRHDRRFGPLERAQAFGQQKPKYEPMDFRLRMRTVQPKAIQVLTNLTRDPIPIDLDVTYDDRAIERRAVPSAPTRQPASVLSGRVRVESATRSDEDLQAATVIGQVRIGETRVDLFRRNAVLNSLKVELLESGAQNLEGRIQVRYLDYDIFILIGGEVGDPQIKLLSSPPLEDDQILSVLIFGRPLTELGEDERASVSNLNAAFTDAVLGLSSLFILASTPIESVGYDVDRKMVTAKLSLGGGASLEVGSRGDSLAGIGFRKRLSREFILRSDIERIGTSGKRTISAFVEWIRRF